MLVGAVLMTLSARHLRDRARRRAGLVLGSVVLGTGHLLSVVGQQAAVANTAGPGRFDSAFGYYTFAASLGQAAGPALITLLGGRGRTARHAADLPHRHGPRRAPRRLHRGAAHAERRPGGAPVRRAAAWAPCCACPACSAPCWSAASCWPPSTSRSSTCPRWAPTVASPPARSASCSPCAPWPR